MRRTQYIAEYSVCMQVRHDWRGAHSLPNKESRSNDRMHVDVLESRGGGACQGLSGLVRSGIGPFLPTPYVVQITEGAHTHTYIHTYVLRTPYSRNTEREAVLRTVCADWRGSATSRVRSVTPSAVGTLFRASVAYLRVKRDTQPQNVLWCVYPEYLAM